jgi:hypothetical protein
MTLTSDSEDESSGSTGPETPDETPLGSASDVVSSDLGYAKDCASDQSASATSSPKSSKSAPAGKESGHSANTKHLKHRPKIAKRRANFDTENESGPSPRNTKRQRVGSFDFEGYVKEERQFRQEQHKTLLSEIQKSNEQYAKTAESTARFQVEFLDVLRNMNK